MKRNPPYKAIAFLILLLVFSVSCENEDEVAPPQNLVEEGKMIDALVATHILEQQVNNLRVPKKAKKDSFDTYQQRVFSRLSIDSSAYYESYEYYVTPGQVDAMLRIMDSVADSLSALRSEVTPNRN